MASGTTVAGERRSWLWAAGILAIGLSAASQITYEPRPGPPVMLASFGGAVPPDDTLLSFPGWEATDSAFASSPAPLDPTLPPELPWYQHGLCKLGDSIPNYRLSSRRLIPTHGDNPTEAAVATAMQWLDTHKQPDGGWNFDHRTGDSCTGKCTHPGNYSNRTAATALALLPFLGAGQTQSEGKYKRTVRDGLHFLLLQMSVDEFTDDYRDGHAEPLPHALRALVLSEVYRMTRDKSLAPRAQMAVDYIVRTQQASGGWRLHPDQWGSPTSLFGWQLLALNSSRNSGLEVPDEAFERARQFLAELEIDDARSSSLRITQVADLRWPTGLLCRRLLGGKKDDRRMERGAAGLAIIDPDQTSLQYQFFATLLMHRYRLDGWERWHRAQRDFLVQKQEKNGHAKGSWLLSEPDAATGGRLYSTALAALTLEVYYRHLPAFAER